MRTIAAALMFVGLATNSMAQTPAAAPAPVAAPPASCAELPPAPVPPDGATVAPAQMAAANQAYQAWRQQVVAGVECRRAQYNGLVDSMNATNTAWGASFTAFCARRTIHCDNAQAPNAAAPAAPPAHY